MNYKQPEKKIHSIAELESFKKSKTCKDVLDFVKLCAESVAGVKNDNEMSSILVNKFVLFMDRLYCLVDEIPPIQQPMRFGNKAFRDWHTKMITEADSFLLEILPANLNAAAVELAPYLYDMFGNNTRIDYGTGHELNFSILFQLLHKLGLLHETEITTVITKGFVAYIRTMRRLQMDYMLEPAGSHGVWGLDDYHCLLFLWGSAQLSKQPTAQHLADCGETVIKPASIHDAEILKEHSQNYIYLEGISFIKTIKKGAPFAETSPMLNDISGQHDWARICAGLMRLFQGEVLFKLPVIQHLTFGTLLPCTWGDSSRSSSSSNNINSSHSADDVHNVAQEVHSSDSNGDMDGSNDHVKC